MSLLHRSALGARRWATCPTISATMSASASPRWRWDFWSACRSRSSRAIGRCCAARCSGSPASCRRCRDWRCWRCSIRCCWRSRRSRCRGSAFGFSAFGFLPAVLALALYSMLPVLRNTITGLQGVDAAILEAAQGVGMTPRQSLFTVELPLALPVMMAGIRTAAVWVIGTATLSTPIGQTSLGNYIFAGLQTQNWVFVLFGCLAAAVLALAVDQLLALIESGLRHRSRLRAGLGGVGIAALVAATLVPTMMRSQTNYVVGAKTFTEQYVLSALMAQRLKAASLPATTREGLGSNVIFEALASQRYRRLCRLFRHAVGQPVPAQRHQAARGAAGRTEDDAGEAEHHAVGRTRLRERLCAGDAAQARRATGHPHHRRPRLARGEHVDRRRL